MMLVGFPGRTSPAALSSKLSRWSRFPLFHFLTAAVVLILASGCGSRKEAEKRWSQFTAPSLGGDIKWFANQQELSGTVIFRKPFEYRTDLKGRGAFVMREGSIAMVRDEYQGAVELRAAHSFQDKAFLQGLERLLSTGRKLYTAESVDGPEIAGRKSSQVTLKPKAGSKYAAITSVTDVVERYFLDAEMGFPLGYELLDSSGNRVYGWQFETISVNQQVTATQFYHFPLGETYSCTLYLPAKQIKGTGPSDIVPVTPEEAAQKLGYPLFALGRPYSLRTVTIYSARPVSDFSEKNGAFVYLLQAPVVDPAKAAVELNRGVKGWKDARRERHKNGEDFGPDNLGLHTLHVGNRDVTYDNFFGIVKAFGWTENGMAMTVVTSGDFREALASIASGAFR